MYSPALCTRLPPGAKEVRWQHMNSFKPDFEYLRKRTCGYLKDMLDGPDGDNFKAEARRAEDDAWILIHEFNQIGTFKERMMQVEHRCICGWQHELPATTGLSHPCVWKKL